MSKGFASNRLSLLAIGVIACFVSVGVRKRYYRVSGADAFTMRRDPVCPV